MGRIGALKEEDGSWVNRRRDGTVDRATLRLGALLLRMGLLLSLLRLFRLLASLATDRLARHRRARPESRQQDRNGQFPLHAVDVTTPRLNRK